MSKKCCICDALPEVLPKKKSSFGKKLFVTAAIIGTTAVAVKSIKRLVEAKKEDLERGNQYRDTKEYLNVFNGQNLVIDGSEECKDMKIKAMFAGSVINMTAANITKDISLEITSVCGGIRLLIPEGINVQTDCKALASGIANPTEYVAGQPTIYISGNLFCSGLQIQTGADSDN